MSPYAPGRGRQLAAASRKLQVADRNPLTVNCRLQSAICSLPLEAASFRQSIASRQLLSVDRRLPAASRKLQAVGHRPQSVNFNPSAAVRGLPLDFVGRRLLTADRRP